MVLVAMTPTLLEVQVVMAYVLPSTSSLDIFLRVDGQLPLTVQMLITI